MLASETSRTSAVKKKERMTFLTGPDSFGKKRYGGASDWLFLDDQIKCVRSILQAETYALSDGVEKFVRLRAALAETHGVFLRTNWECHTVRFMRNVWMID